MRLASNTVAACAAVLVLSPAFLLTGCHKQQNNAQVTHAPANRETIAGGGRHGRLRAVCADDIQKYCANAERPRRCLRENIDKLSDPCKAAVSQRGGRRARGEN